jgi:hypothetical protein
MAINERRDSVSDHVSVSLATPPGAFAGEIGRSGPAVRGGLREIRPGKRENRHLFPVQNTGGVEMEEAGVRRGEPSFSKILGELLCRTPARRD